MTLSAIMNRTQFDEYCRENGIASKQNELFNTLDELDSRVDEEIDFAKIPKQKLRDAIGAPPPLQRQFLSAVEDVQSWWHDRPSCSGEWEREARLRDKFVAYRDMLLDLTLSNEALAFGDPVAIGDASEIIYQVSGIPRETLGSLNKPSRLIVDMLRESDNPPMLYDEGHRNPAFEPRSFEGAMLFTGQSEVSDLSVTVMPYEIKTAGITFNGGDIVDGAVGVGFFVLMVLAAAGGKRGSEGPVIAPGGAEGRSPVSTPKLELPGQALAKLREERRDPWDYKVGEHSNGPARAQKINFQGLSRSDVAGRIENAKTWEDIYDLAVIAPRRPDLFEAIDFPTLSARGPFGAQAIAEVAKYRPELEARARDALCQSTWKDMGLRILDSYRTFFQKLDVPAIMENIRRVTGRK